MRPREHRIAELAATAGAPHPQTAARDRPDARSNRPLAEIRPAPPPLSRGLPPRPCRRDRRCSGAWSGVRLRSRSGGESPQRRMAVAPTPRRQGGCRGNRGRTRLPLETWHPRPPRSRPRSPRRPQARRDPDHLAGTHDLRPGRRCQAARAGASDGRGVRAAACATQRARLPTCPPCIPPWHPRAPRPPRRRAPPH